MTQALLKERVKVNTGLVEIRRPKVKVKEYPMLDGSKKTLVQQVADGSIIKRFDKTPVPEKPTDVVCPHFLELKWAYGCPYDCSWCYLKGTFRFHNGRILPGFKVKDFDKIKLHVEEFLNKVDESEILNTGEIADSLMYEGNSKSFSSFIIPIFESQNRHKVLFLTKSNKVENLLKADLHNQIIVSFSLNAEPVAKEWELKAPTPCERLKAARKLYEKGYEIRLRIDPIVPIEDWERHYLELIDQIFNSLIPERITLGSLRGLQSTINGSSDRSWVKFLTERSNWGQKIEFNLRYNAYKRVIDYLQEKYSYKKIALCKETKAMWKVLNMDYRQIRCNCIW
ncbi:MAG: spore photoproduct lyase family protein [bacterium]